MEGRRWRVEGRVQGVGFRWWARSVAQELTLAGHVRNLLDGTVEAVAYGETGSLDRFADRLRDGPPGALVTAVRSEPADLPANPPTSFTILHGGG